MSAIRNYSKGFTIVELLIVIVVIAILAAITIVAYNGIQECARATTIQSDLNNIAKKIEMYAVDNGHYPSSSAELYLGTAAPIRLSSFSTGSDPYQTVLYGYDGTNYLISARQNNTTNWYTIGSGLSMQIKNGNSGTATTACTNLGMASSTYQSWVKGSTWSASLQA